MRFKRKAKLYYRETVEVLGKLRFDPLPIRKNIRGYSLSKAGCDIRAGLNVALLAFPQSMAYAVIAGLPIEYGVFGSIIAGILGALFTSTRFIVLGPTNATSVLIGGSFVALGIGLEQRPEVIPSILLLTGIFLTLGAIFKVASLIQYISRSVITGYITAAAIYIIINQTKKCLGIDFSIPQGTTFFGVVRLTIENAINAHLPTVFLSIATAALFFILNKRFRRLPNVAIVLVVMSALAALLSYGQNGSHGVELMLTSIYASDLSFALPSLNDEIVSQYAGVALTLAFLIILEGTSIGKSLASRAGEKLDSNQEMLSMGVTNLFSSFYPTMPASGSVVRSQLNWDSGAVTPASTLFCSLILILITVTIGPLTKFIPQAVVGALVICIGLSLINRKNIRVVTRTTRSDALVFVATFMAALLVRLDFAILFGASISILLFLRKAATPELIEYTFNDEGELAAMIDDGVRSHPKISIVHIEGELFFGAAELFRDQMRRACEDPNLKVVILKMRNAHNLDATSVMALEELLRFMKDKERYLIISEARKDAIRIFKNSGLIEEIGRDMIFPDDVSNPTRSTAKALRKAQELLGDQEIDIAIFTSNRKKKKEEE